MVSRKAMNIPTNYVQNSVLKSADTFHSHTKMFSIKPILILCCRQAMLAVCREFQILFNETREKALKAIAFSKTLRKDLENGVLKEGISPQCNAIIAEALEELTVSGLLSAILQLCTKFLLG